MKESTHTAIEIILVSLLMIISAALGYIANPEIESILNKLTKNYEDAPEECTNRTLVETAYCLNNYVANIYKYEVTQDLIKLDIEELKENGGDCKNWAELYYDSAENLGFSVERPVISTGNKTAHTFTIMSDETGYCLLDQLSVDCFALGNEY